MERLPPDQLTDVKAELTTVANSLSGLFVTVYGANSRELADPGRLFPLKSEGHGPMEYTIYSKLQEGARSREVQNAMNLLEKYVQGFPMKKQGCVNYGNVFFRLVRENHSANLIVASSEPCDKPGLKAASEVSLPRIVVLIMVRTRDHDQEFAIFQERERKLRRIFPNARFLSESEISKLPALLSGADTDTDGAFVISESRNPRHEAVVSRSASHKNCLSPDTETRTGTQMRLGIIYPKNEQQVGTEMRVEGNGACSRDIWLVVYPQGTGTFWVQAKTEMRSAGVFTGTAVLGRGGSIDCGKSFFIRAFESPRSDLYPGQQLSSWPDAEAASISVAVTRTCQRNGL